MQNIFLQMVHASLRMELGLFEVIFLAQNSTLCDFCYVFHIAISIVTNFFAYWILLLLPRGFLIKIINLELFSRTSAWQMMTH